MKTRSVEELRALVWEHLNLQLLQKFGRPAKLRITTREWKSLLLEDLDYGFTIRGHVYGARGKSIGFGLVEISLEDK